MKAYELLYFMAPSSDEDSRQAVSNRIETTLSSLGGSIDNVEEWGKRKLAYEVDGLAEGDYVLVDFHSEPNQIAELDRILRITDAVKRHIIVSRNDRS